MGLLPQSLNINVAFFDHSRDLCFCLSCAKARGEEQDTYCKPANILPPSPPCVHTPAVTDLRGQPRKKYVVPKDFTGFAVRQSTQRLQALEVFDSYHVCCAPAILNLPWICFLDPTLCSIDHGIEPKNLASILEVGGLLFPGSVDHNGREVKARDEGETGGSIRPGRKKPVGAHHASKMALR